MTEDEAKKKWCPLNGIAALISNNDASAAKCDASACMMWRWNERQTRLVKGEGYMKNDGTREQLVTESQEDAGGYCGLGGKP